MGFAEKAVAHVASRADLVLVGFLRLGIHGAQALDAHAGKVVT